MTIQGQIPAVSNLIHTFLTKFNCNINNESLSNYALIKYKTYLLEKMSNNINVIPTVTS